MCQRLVVVANCECQLDSCTKNYYKKYLQVESGNKVSGWVRCFYFYFSFNIFNIIVVVGDILQYTLYLQSSQQRNIANDPKGSNTSLFKPVQASWDWPPLEVGNHNRWKIAPPFIQIPPLSIHYILVCTSPHASLRHLWCLHRRVYLGGLQVLQVE